MSKVFGKFHDDEDKISHPSPRFEAGQMIVPAGFEEYYASLWRWKVNMGLPLEKPKFMYLVEYERVHGLITHRRTLNGTLIPMPEPKRSNKN